MKYFSFFIYLLPLLCRAQNSDVLKFGYSNGQLTDNTAFSPSVFINNIGQYGTFFKGYTELGEVKYGFEGFNMPVLFTPKGIIYLHRKIYKYSKQQEEELEEKGISEAIIERGYAKDKSIAVEWLNANTQVEIIADSSNDSYFTYGVFKNKAYGYKRITYKELYPNIDLVFSFNNTSKIGFEYTFVVKPNGNVNDIKVKYKGNVKNITQLVNGTLAVNSGIDEFTESAPIAFTASYTASNTKTPVASSFSKSKNIISFNVADYDKSKTLYIDPFVSNTATLNGTNNAIAKDVDFDYDGNIYVSGGGDGAISHKLAKYNAAGALLWTFSGTLTVPSWDFGISYGGWVVEKTTGNVFLGQGLGVPNGSRVIRVNSNGVYDNYISDANFDFSENWKMFWNCNSGVPQIYVAGGTNSGNNSLGICTPPSTTINSTNLSGLPNFNQDIADIVIDPANNDLYVIYATAVTASGLNNKIFRHSIPYSPASIIWSTPSGFNTLEELENRPYLSSNMFNNTENSANVLAVNSSYLFYWDGLNLKAFNKATGTAVGTPLVLTTNVALMQGGIVADECNNIFIGNTNGTIKVFNFNGVVFDDAAVADITINGFPAAGIYDMVYDQTRKLLYACGAGFVASIDVSNYCPATTYNLSVAPNCNTLSAQATITPAPNAGIAVTFILFSGTTQIASNSIGLFTGLTPGGSYTIKAFLNQACGGLQLIDNFVLDNCPLSVTTTFTNSSCNANNGTITAVANFGTPPYQYSIDGTTFQAAGFFNNLPANTYTITVRDFTNTTIASLPIVLSNATTLQITATAVNTSCSLNNGSIVIMATGGAAPLQYSIDGINYQVSNTFLNLPVGGYTAYVKDANNCIVNITSPVVAITPPAITATAAPTGCNNTSGSIAATASFGKLPYLFSLDNVNYQTANVFLNLPTAGYTVYVKDSSGCISNTNVSVALNNTLVANAGNNITICEGTIQKILATSNATNFEWLPATGLSNANILQPDASPAVTTPYTLTAKNIICTVSSTVTVFVNAAPVANAGTDPSICFGKDVQLSGSGGINYQWRPVTYLNSPIIFNPISVKPDAGQITYYLSVFDANGCKSVNEDTVVINVSSPPQIFAGNDTSIIINNPFQLNAVDVNNTGFINYMWTPNYGLSNNQIKNPIAVLDRDITYTVSAENANGCVGSDAVSIKVFKGPYIYVPNAFTPNGDKRNDVLRVFPVGMKAFIQFSIYNRYGELVFTTKNPLNGWDGTNKGSTQPKGAYIWLVEAVDNNGNSFKLKGSAVLIR